MKVIQLVSGREYILSDEEADYAKKVYMAGAPAIELTNGDVIARHNISLIGEPDKKPQWHGYPLNKDGRSFMRDGQRIYLERDSFGEIEYVDDPKYLTMPKVGILKLNAPKK